LFSTFTGTKIIWQIYSLDFNYRTLNTSNYNFLAPFYKSLSRLVFGKGLEQGATHYFYRIKEKEKVLIVGGGNGELLKSLYNVCPSATVTYCEFSSKMIGLANKKNPFLKEQISFLEKDAFTLEDFGFDWVILPFFLDQFEGEQCVSFLKKIMEKSKENTQILFSDMHEAGISKVLLGTMYFFFKITTGLKNNKLPDFNKVFVEAGWIKEKEELFSNGRVLSGVYGK